MKHLVDSAVAQGCESGGKLWMPYARIGRCDFSMRVESADGMRIILEDGSSLLDGISSWWVMCHGYSNSYILDRMRSQLSKCPHVMLSNFVSEQTEIFAERILQKTSMNSVLFAESGSVAVEAAMKIALQHHENSGDVRRSKFLGFKNGYHGETMGAMSVTDVSWKKGVNFGSENYCMSIPTTAEEWDAFDKKLGQICDGIAAVIIEPLVQFAGGMVMHGGDTLRKIFDISKKHNLLFIVDEIATGFYRTGTLFAYEQAGITPDIVVIGKAMAAGYYPAGAAIVGEKIYDSFACDDASKSLMHGTTFMGNPVMSAAANASLDVFEGGDIEDTILDIERFMARELKRFLCLDVVSDIRVKGAVGVIELREDDTDYISALRREVVKHGVWLRPFSNVLYVVPPFIVSEQELGQILDAAFAALSAKV